MKIKKNSYDRELISSDIKEKTLTLLIEGEGQTSYIITSQQDNKENNAKEPTKIKVNEKDQIILNPKANKGWKFVKWIKNDEELSNNQYLELSINENTTLKAVIWKKQKRWVKKEIIW